MPEPLVTVIVPFWNAARHFDECLASLRSQTIADRVAVVLVDDGSTDESSAMARRFVEETDHARLLRTDRLGPGAARNRGLDTAETPYVTFLDADDVLPDRSLELRLAALERWQADVVIGRLELIMEGHEWRPVGLETDRLITDVADAPGLMVSLSTCNKLFHTSFFSDPEHRFEEGVRFEDAPVTAAALIGAKRIGIVSDVCYLYRKDDNPTSLMNGLLDRTQNFRDHLVVNERMARQHRGDERSRSIIEPVLIRSIRSFLAAAPSRLDGAELEDFYRRARQLYGGSPPTLVAEHMTVLHWTVPFYALFADDFDLFRKGMSAVTGLRVDDEGAEVVLDRPTDPALAEILRVQPEARGQAGAASLTIDDVRSSRHGTELAGSLTVRRRGRHPVPITALELTLGLDSRSVPLDVVVDGDDPGSKTGRWTATVPGPLGRGTHPLSARSAWQPDVEVPVAAAPYTGPRRSRARVQTKGSSTVLVSRSRWYWVARRVYRALSAVRRRLPG